MAADDSAPAAAAGQEQGQSADVLITIRALLPNLAPVEQRVAQQVMKDPFGCALPWLPRPPTPERTRWQSQPMTLSLVMSRP